MLERRLPPGHRPAARLQGRSVLGVQVRPDRRRGRPAALLDLRAQRQRARIRPHPAVPRARLQATSRSSCSTTTRNCWPRRSRSETSTARITRFEKLTHDIRGIEIELDSADQVLGGPICRHHRHHRRRGDDYALVLHGKYAERNPESSPSSSRNTPTENSPDSSTPAESRSAPRSRSSDPTAPASDAKTETEP